jgi:hypothetical protein
MHRRKTENPESKAAGSQKKLEGRYANYFKVGYNAFEFVFDFGQYYPETDEAELYTRIITNPSYAKIFFETLKESIDRYEEVFGAINKKNEGKCGD